MDYEKCFKYQSEPTTTKNEATILSDLDIQTDKK